MTFCMQAERERERERERKREIEDYASKRPSEVIPFSPTDQIGEAVLGVRPGAPPWDAHST